MIFQVDLVLNSPHGFGFDSNGLELKVEWVPDKACAMQCAIRKLKMIKAKSFIEAWIVLSDKTWATREKYPLLPRQ